MEVLGALFYSIFFVDLVLVQGNADPVEDFLGGFSFSNTCLLLEKKKEKWVVIGKVVEGRDVTRESDLVIH